MVRSAWKWLIPTRPESWTIHREVRNKRSGGPFEFRDQPRERLLAVDGAAHIREYVVGIRADQPDRAHHNH